MNTKQLTAVVIALFDTSASTGALAMDLYMDSKTQQIYGTPAPGRVFLGTFEKAGGAEVKPAPAKPGIASEKPATSTASTDEVKLSLKNGIKLASHDGSFTAELHGRVQTDAQENINQQLEHYYAGDGTPTSLNDSVGFRRARISMEGIIYKALDYKFEYDFTRGGGTTAVGITDAFMRYNFSKPFSIKIGSFKEAASLEETTSDIQTTFIERNMAVNTFIDNLNVFKVGIGANYATERWQVATGLQTSGPGAWGPANVNGTSITNNTASGNGGVNNNGGQGDTGWEINGRLSGTPWMENKNHLLHVGGWGSYVNVNNNYSGTGAFKNGGVVFANGIGGNMDRSAILSTGNLTALAHSAIGSRQTNHFDRFGFESAWVNGPFSAQAEYLQTDVYGTGYGSSDSLNGFYGYMTYFLTGESRNYITKTASFDRIKPNHNFDLSQNGWGAFEIAAGYDSMNLNNATIRGGRASTVKFAVNWYLNPRVRLMTNYIHTLDISTNSNTTTGTAPANPYNNAQFDLIEERVQIDW